VSSIRKQTGAAGPGPSAAPESGPDVPGTVGADASRAAADQALLEAFGGVWGMVDSTVPGLVFVVCYTARHDLRTAAIAALGLTLALALVRLARRQTLKHAFSGVVGVAIGAVFAVMSGNAKNFYLPGMLYTLGLGVAYLVSALAGFPMIGLLLGPLLKENLSWRDRNPGRRVAYTKSTWAWGAILLAKSAIVFPLYWWGDATQLGWVKVALGIPPFLLAVYLTWIFLAKAPPPIDVIAEMEEQEKREEQQERERAARRAGATVAGEPADEAVGAAEGSTAERLPPT
jgi:hypothetical protein